jgi:hypothetical protein
LDWENYGLYTQNVNAERDFKEFAIPIPFVFTCEEIEAQRGKEIGQRSQQVGTVRMQPEVY